MHGCLLSTVATDALVLRLQAISINSADEISIALDEFQKKTTFVMNNIRKWNKIKKKIPWGLRVNENVSV